MDPAPDDPTPSAEPVAGELGKGGYWEDRGDYAWYAGI